MATRVDKAASNASGHVSEIVVSLLAMKKPESFPFHSHKSV